MKSIIDAVVQEVTTVLDAIDVQEADNFSAQLKKAKRIFVYGEGRSGLMGKAFAMRLMHGGFTVYVIGETITPSIDEDDLLVIISGSGSTGAVSQFASKAKETGADIFLVTTNRASPMAALSEGILTIPAATKFRRADEPQTIQPLGNQFDQSVHLLLDAIIISTVQQSAEMEVNEEMAKRHANLE